MIEMRLEVDVTQIANLDSDDALYDRCDTFMVDIVDGKPKIVDDAMLDWLAFVSAQKPNVEYRFSGIYEPKYGKPHISFSFDQRLSNGILFPILEYQALV